MCSGSEPFSDAQFAEACPPFTVSFDSRGRKLWRRPADLALLSLLLLLASYPRSCRHIQGPRPAPLCFRLAISSFGHVCSGSSLRAVCCCLGLFFCLLPEPHSSDPHTSVISFEIRECELPTLFFSLKTPLSITRPLQFHMNFRTDSYFWGKKKPFPWGSNRDRI